MLREFSRTRQAHFATFSLSFSSGAPVACLLSARFTGHIRDRLKECHSYNLRFVRKCCCSPVDGIKVVAKRNNFARNFVVRGQYRPGLPGATLSQLAPFPGQEGRARHGKGTGPRTTYPCGQLDHRDGAVHTVREKTAIGCPCGAIPIHDCEHLTGGAHNGESLLIHFEVLGSGRGRQNIQAVDRSGLNVVYRHKQPESSGMQSLRQGDACCRCKNVLAGDEGRSSAVRGYPTSSKALANCRNCRKFLKPMPSASGCDGTLGDGGTPQSAPQQGYV